MCQSYSPGLGIFPVLFLVCSFLTFLVTYMVSISNGDVFPYFPTISDTGAKKPEQNIFSLFLSISSFLALIIVIIRYTTYRFVSRGIDQKQLKWLNAFGLIMGAVAAIGAGLVASFQNVGISAGGHILGALAVFGGGTIYSWIQTYLTYQLLRFALNTRRLCWCRLLLSSLCTILICVFLTTYYFSAKAWKKHHDKNHSFLDWESSDAGYPMHVVSSACEWLLMICLFIYFASFTKEFNKLRVSLHVHRQRLFVTQFQTSFSEDGESMEYA